MILLFAEKEHCITVIAVYASFVVSLKTSNVSSEVTCEIPPFFSPTLRVTAICGLSASKSLFFSYATPENVRGTRT
jgi:hypothetical protein